MNTLHFTIVTPDGRTYEDDVIKVTVPTQQGDVTIHPRHIQMISVMQAGEIVIHKDDKEPRRVATSGGILAVRPGGETVQVLADTAERAEDIDLERAKKAKARAEQLLKESQNMQDVDFARVQAQIEKELARITTGNKYKKL